MPEEIAATSEALGNVSKPLSLRAGIAWTGLGNVVYLASQYVMLMVIAKLGDAERVGQFSLAFAITAPVFIFSQMNLRQLQVTDVKNEYSNSDYFWLRILSTGLAMLIVAAITTFSGYSSSMMWLILIVGFAKAVESISDIALGQMQRHERMDLAAFSLLTKGILSCVALSALMWKTRDLHYSVFGMAGIWLLTLVFYDLPIQSRLSCADTKSGKFCLESIGKLLFLAFPLAAAAGLGSLSTNLPRYFLEHYHGGSAVAHFSVAAAPLMMLLLINGSVGQATLVRASSYFQADQFGAFKRLTLKITVLQLLMGIIFIGGSVAAGERLVAILFTPEYASSAKVTTIMAIGVTLGSFGVFGATVIYATRRPYLQLILILATLLLQIPTCWYLVSTYGIIGASWADCLKYVIATSVLAIIGTLVCYTKRSGVK